MLAGVVLELGAPRTARTADTLVLLSATVRDATLLRHRSRSGSARDPVQVWSETETLAPLVSELGGVQQLAELVGGQLAQRRRRGARPAATGPIAVRVSRRTGWPTWSSSRRTIRLRPSWMTSSTIERSCALPWPALTTRACGP